MRYSHALDERSKRRLKSLVLQLRGELEEDLTKQLRRLGVDPKKETPTPIEKLSYLDDHEVAVRRNVDALIKKEQEVTRNFAAAVASIVREGAYTHLNRLVGLRCMETRKLLTVDGEATEVVTSRPEYGGRPRLLWTMREADERYRHGEDAEERLWRHGLERAFRSVTDQIRVLFDPNDPYAQLWPSHATLRRVIEALNDLPPEVFQADETLGWLYQYFQSEEKKRVFDEVATKKLKIQWHDIIPVTSLYTERYMVDFLLQNSLGALWMEMYPDSTLYRSWPYYVRPATSWTRPAKPVREWRVLDPACGSGHFLLVAFDLFRQLYAEERRLAEAGRIPSDWVVPEAQVPATILRENLYGIDIDPRSVQISALALWLKARSAGLTEQPTLNLVTADCVLGEGGAYQALLDRYNAHPAVKEAIRSIWRSLQHVRDFGSLIRVEEELEAAVKKAIQKERKDAPLLERLVDWNEYRARLLRDLRTAFLTEAKTEDVGQRLFGIEGQKGIDLVEALSRRYDVVCTNPPYMGSKNMGQVLKDFVGKHYAAGKRDLYAAFVLRCLQLAKEGGYVAMVTQQSWMFLRSFADFRAVEGNMPPNSRLGYFRGILRQTSIGVVAHLGEYAFEDVSAAGAFAVLFTLRNSAPSRDHRFTAFRLIGPKSPGEKDALLREAVAGRAKGVVFRPEQRRFFSIPQSPLCYWVRPRFFELLAGRTLGDVAHVVQGLATADNNRFVRFVWEIPVEEWRRDVRERRWVPFEKGGGYGRWFGHQWWVVDWENNGERIKAYPKARVQNEAFYFRQGWTYSFMARGSLGVRWLDGESIFSDASSAVVPRADEAIAIVANCPAASHVIRSISARIQLRESYVSRVPVPLGSLRSLLPLEGTFVALRRDLVTCDPTERAFARSWLESQHHRGLSTGDEDLAVAAVLHALEGWSHRIVFQAYGLEQADTAAVVAETGTPAGWHPFVAGYDAVPPIPRNVAVLPDGFTEYLAAHERRVLDPSDLSSLKARLRTLYEAGPGEVVEEEVSDTAQGEDKDEESGLSLGAYIPIPTETFIEELSQKLEIHPISVYWLLEELRREEGLMCKPELKRHVEDYFSVIILRMLGHRWPEQDRYEQEQGYPMIDPKWVDADGIIPLHPCAGEPRLIVRLQSYLDEQFGPEHGPKIETQAGEILGKPLERWVERDFFRRHVSQFRKRPIAWHIKSEGGTFQAIVYYHKFNHDRLHTLRAKYVKDTLDVLRRQLAEAQQKGGDSHFDLAAVARIEEQLADVRKLDERLRELLEGKNPDYRIWVPWKNEADQPRGWRPDVNDGVRVNIAPVQRAGLLAAPVLSERELKSLRGSEERS